jgi:hypothetical protein
MFKKLTLIVLFFISNAYADDTHKTSWTEKIKNSPVVVKVFAAIVPCIALFIAMNKVMINYKDNENIVYIAWQIKWAAAAIASIFGNLLMKVNFKNWMDKNSQKYKACNASESIIIRQE